MMYQCYQIQLYILAFVLKKDNKSVFKVTNTFCVVGIFSHYRYFFFFFEMNLIIIFVHQKSQNPAFKTGFLVFNNHLNLCGQAENYKWIFCSRKTGVECGYLRSFMYKKYFTLRFGFLNSVRTCGVLAWHDCLSV